MNVKVARQFTVEIDEDTARALFVLLRELGTDVEKGTVKFYDELPLDTEQRTKLELLRHLLGQNLPG